MGKRHRSNIIAAMGTNTAKMIYGSTNHLTLCYAKVFKNRPVTSEEVAECLAGRFGWSRTPACEVRIVMRKNVNRGYMRKVADNQWQITQAGVIQVYDMANNFKKTRQKIVGQKFLDEMQVKLSKCSLNIFEVDLDKPDLEDEILEKIYVRFKEISERRAHDKAEKDKLKSAVGKNKKATRKS